MLKMLSFRTAHTTQVAWGGSGVLGALSGFTYQQGLEVRTGFLFVITGFSAVVRTKLTLRP